jgi:NADH-quinone oxidoreductase subunit C
MDEKLQPAVTALSQRFGGEASEFRGETTVIVPPEQLVEACRTLRDEFGFDMLVSETAVDYWPQESPRFHVVYHIYSMTHGALLRLRTPISGTQPEVDSIEPVFPVANWMEREIWDMFGVRFKGHSDLRRILMPHDWQGHPLRKDYPLGYEEVQFTFNYDEIDIRKPHPKE